jgi:hypothetical protein
MACCKVELMVMKLQLTSLFSTMLDVNCMGRYKSSLEESRWCYVAALQKYAASLQKDSRQVLLPSFCLRTVCDDNSDHLMAPLRGAGGRALPLARNGQDRPHL